VSSCRICGGAGVVIDVCVGCELDLFSLGSNFIWKKENSELVWFERMICERDIGFGLKGASEWSVMGRPK